MTMTLKQRIQKFAALGLLIHALAAPVIASGSTVEMQHYGFVPNIAYRTETNRTDRPQESCALDVYYPEQTNGFATVVWFHGGGMKTGKRAVPAELKKQGIAVVAAGYGLSPQVKAPGYIEDAAAAVAWTFQHIEEYGGSQQRIFVAGSSAGGYLATLIGLDQRWLAAHKIAANRIAGIISLSGQAITHFTVREELGIKNTQPVIDDLAPLFHVRKDAPPLLLVTGDRELELLGRYEENAYFWRMMRIVGHTRTELHELPGLDHGGVEKPAQDFLLKFVRKIDAEIVTAGDKK